VIDAGAIGAVASEPVPGVAGTVLHVPDTLRALQQAGRFARRRWGRQIVAITGSAGKTGTKDIIATILATRFRVGKSAGNLNNHLGLPLSLLRMPGDAEVGVLEMGMNHAGEICLLARIAEPQIGVITNVGFAHVEAFDSVEGVAAAKRELIEELPAHGIAVLNADDARVLAFRDYHPGRIVLYGFAEHADIRAIQLESGPGGMAFTVHGVRFNTVLTGRHSVSNILAGLAVANLSGIRFEELVPVIAALQPSKMRGERTTRGGVTVLNDSYNSNPEAARSMLDVLRDEPAKRRIAVLGEMRELGHMAVELHRDIGSYAARAGIDVLIGVCGASRFMVEQAIKSGHSSRTALFFEDPATAGTFLRDFVRAGDAILFKGSRGTHVEEALARMEE
ncbi:MAG: UDP-N-acetylmuramoyl-tripeptide--D-alanyl-D-alanine ligase, partial [Bryobacterales bacterium]|nr:UDP-N-acetylmuramoyl-tripeptide--D-alanyl-D-alanine ligase [Bryobacterales bacterium]